MDFSGMALRTVGIAAIGMATGLTSATALAQQLPPASADVYSPPFPSAEVYHPGPARTQPFAYNSSAVPVERRAVSPVVSPIISEEESWWLRKDGRYAIFAVFAAIVVLLGGSVMWTIHNHKDGR